MAVVSDPSKEKAAAREALIRRKIAVSVIMPAWNVERYVEEAVESILEQKDVAFELLIADDASTDKTWSRLQQYRSDPRVRLWRLKRRRGASAVRNLLLSSARGFYVAPCDADDVFLRGYLGALHAAVKKRPFAGVVFLRRFLQKKGRKIGKSREVLGPHRAWDLLGRGSIGNSGTLIRRSTMERVGGYDSRLPFLHDYDLFLRLAEVTRFLCVKGKPLFIYRKRAGTLSDCSSGNYKRFFQSILRKTILRRYSIRVPW